MGDGEEGPVPVMSDWWRENQEELKKKNRFSVVSQTETLRWTVQVSSWTFDSKPRLFRRNFSEEGAKVARV